MPSCTHCVICIWISVNRDFLHKDECYSCLAMDRCSSPSDFPKGAWDLVAHELNKSKAISDIQGPYAVPHNDGEILVCQESE